VIEGETTQFTITPDNGYQIQSVSGCNGNLVGNTYTTGPIMGDCAVTAFFNQATSDVAITIDDNQTFAQYGETLTYVITLNNPGTAAATGVSVSNAFPPELDVSQATWTCSAGSGGTCTPSGTGALTDSGVVVPSQGSVTYTLIAPVRTDTSSGQVNNQVTVNGPAGSHSANDVDTLVIFRSGFEANGGLISAPAHPADKTR
jgi:uncharacterized repeat protein (TIGR01451 family)